MLSPSATIAAVAPAGGAPAVGAADGNAASPGAAAVAPAFDGFSLPPPHAASATMTPHAAPSHPIRFETRLVISSFPPSSCLFLEAQTDGLARDPPRGPE